MSYIENELCDLRKAANIRVAKFLKMEDADLRSEQEREEVISHNGELKKLRDNLLSAYERLLLFVQNIKTSGFNRDAYNDTQEERIEVLTGFTSAKKVLLDATMGCNHAQ
jgi:hypothetical protein